MTGYGIAEYVIAFAETFLAYYFAVRMLKHSELEERELLWYGISSLFFAGVLAYNRSLAIVSNGFFFIEVLFLSLTTKKISGLNWKRVAVLFGIYNILEAFFDLWLVILSCLVFETPHLGNIINHQYSVLRLGILSISRVLIFLIFYVFCKKIRTAAIDMILNGKVLVLLLAAGFSEMVYFQCIMVEGVTKGFAKDGFMHLISFFLFCMIFALYMFYRDSKDRADMIELRNYMLEKKLEEQKTEYQGNSLVFHDMKNHLKIIYQFAKKKDYDRLLEYVEAIQPALNQKHTIAWTGNAAMDVIFGYKSAQMEKEKIEYKISADRIGQISIEDRDLCIILSNLLDNAIESSLKMNRAESKVEVSVRRVNEMMLIRINNTCDGPPKEKDGELLTTKENQKMHGLGIASVRKAVMKNDGYFHYDYRNGKFYAEVMLFINDEGIERTDDGSGKFKRRTGENPRNKG